MILYYRSNTQTHQAIKKSFTRLNDQILKISDNNEKISFAFFDLDKNSYEIFDLEDKEIQIRIYKMASFTHISNLNF